MTFHCFTLYDVMKITNSMISYYELKELSLYDIMKTTNSMLSYHELMGFLYDIILITSSMISNNDFVAAS